MCQNVNKGNCVVRVLRHLEDTQYVPPPPRSQDRLPAACPHCVVCLSLCLCVTLKDNVPVCCYLFSLHLVSFLAVFSPEM